MTPLQIGGIAVASLLALIAFAILTYVYVRSRPAQSSDEPRPDQEQTRLKLDKAEELIDELGRLSDDVERRIDGSLSRLQDALARAEAAAAQLRRERSAAPSDTPADAPSEGGADDGRTADIVRLASQGLDPVEIARRTGVNAGEVELVLNLTRARTHKQ